MTRVTGYLLNTENNFIKLLKTFSPSSSNKNKYSFYFPRKNVLFGYFSEDGEKLLSDVFCEKDLTLSEKKRLDSKIDKGKFEFKFKIGEWSLDSILFSYNSLKLSKNSLKVSQEGFEKSLKAFGKFFRCSGNFNNF